MNTTHQFPAQARKLYETQTGWKDSSFFKADSAEMGLFALMNHAGPDDSAILYVEKGEVTLVHDLKTYILSKGMLLYKIPNVTVQLLSFSEDCLFKVFRIRLKSWGI